MTKKDLLKAATTQLRKKNYDRTLKLLEPKVPLMGNDAEFFYLLGLACYYKGDLSGGEIYIKRGLVCAPDSIKLHQLMAVVALRKRDTALAVRMWLEVLDINPDDRKAQDGLDALKSMHNSADLARFIISPAINHLIPDYRTSIPPALFIIPLTAVTLFFAFYAATRIDFNANLPNRSDSDEVVYEQIEETSYQPEQGSFAYTLSAKEINKIMKKASDYFYNHQDNLAQRELNTIKNSNATYDIKHKAERWASALSVPSFASLKNNFSYKEVAKEPLLYENCYVSWQGLINNLHITDEQISFKLFIGYEDKKVLEGEVNVFLDFETYIEPQLATEVLGQVKLDKEGKIYLKAVSIHQIVS